jgi:hypothetical protein
VAGGCKADRSGDFAEIVKVVRFNSDLTKELRATLDALDKAITIRDRDYKKVPTFVTHLNIASPTGT